MTVYRCPFDPGERVQINGLNTPWPIVTGMRFSTKVGHTRRGYTEPGLWLIEVTSSEGRFTVREDELRRGWPEGAETNWPRG